MHVSTSFCKSGQVSASLDKFLQVWTSFCKSEQVSACFYKFLHVSTSFNRSSAWLLNISSSLCMSRHIFPLKQTKFSSMSNFLLIQPHLKSQHNSTPKANSHFPVSPTAPPTEFMQRWRILLQNTKEPFILYSYFLFSIRIPKLPPIISERIKLLTHE